MAMDHVQKRFLLSTVSPSICLLILVFLAPFLYMIWVSCTDLSFSSITNQGDFVGLANYSRAWAEDPIFWSSIKKSAVYMILCVVPQIVLGLLIAEWLATRTLLRKLFSPVLALPVLLPAVTVGLVWRFLLQGEFGIISYYLREIGLFVNRALLSDTKTILVTLSLVDFWQWCPFVVLVFLAARLSLPRSRIETAMMDGAKPWQIFRDVTIPSLLPTIGVVFLIRAIDSFKEFDKVYILTGGGPGSASELSSIYAWRVVFKQWNFGYGAALCTIIYFLIFFGAYLFFWLSTKRWSVE